MGIIDCSSAEINPLDVAQAIFSTVLPSFDKNDIVSIKQITHSMKSRPSRVDSEDIDSDPKSQNIRPPPVIGWFANAAKANEIMRAKTSFTRCNTANLNVSTLGEKFAKHLFHTNIYINEALRSNI